MDLHIHSNISADGIYSVEEVLTFAELAGIDAISITDHNSALAHVLIDNINKEKYYGGKVISGMEIDVSHNGVTFEILAYDFDVQPVQEWATKKFGTVTQRQTIIRDKLYELMDKYNIKYEKDFPWNSQQEFAHINVYNNFSRFTENAKILGIELIDGSDFYRNSTTNKDFKLYLDMSFLWASVDEVKKVVHDNGGKIFLAHLYGYKASVDVNNLLNLAVEKSFDGIEVYHPKHTQEQIEFLENFCKDNNLLMSGGSDFHGKDGERLINRKTMKFWT